MVSRNRVLGKVIPTIKRGWVRRLAISDRDGGANVGVPKLVQQMVGSPPFLPAG